MLPPCVRAHQDAKIQTSTETGNQHKYQTRVVSNANKVNLKFEEAKPACSRTNWPNQSQIFSEPRQEADLTGLLADASRALLVVQPGCNKINFDASRRFEINMKTLSGCAKFFVRP